MLQHVFVNEDIHNFWKPTDAQKDKKSYSSLISTIIKKNKIHLRLQSRFAGAPRKTGLVGMQFLQST